MSNPDHDFPDDMPPFTPKDELCMPDPSANTPHKVNLTLSDQDIPVIWATLLAMVSDNHAAQDNPTADQWALAEGLLQRFTEAVEDQERQPKGLRNCWTCKHDIPGEVVFPSRDYRVCRILTEGLGPTSLVDRVELWCERANLDESIGMPPKDADGCPGYERKA